ncbi:MAG: D-alanyl-D-alanine carboxypeptidase family protein [Gammaproteobacteria bacterium]
MSLAKSSLFSIIPLWLLLVSGASYGRYAAILIDADSGKVLHEVESSQQWYPASLTKVMTLYMTFEALKNGRIHLYDNLTASNHASRQPTSKLGLRTGENLTVEDAILAVVTRSANDAAVVLAEHLAGSEENFAAKMTEKAHSLGMFDTRFKNATGLPNDWQVTTSRDMAILALKIKHNFPQYYPYFSSHSFYFKGRELRGINKFTAKYPGAEGMKTGYTCGSGFNLIGAAHQNGKNLIGVVLGGMSSSERYQLMMDMMDKGFSDKYDTASAVSINTMPAGFSGAPPYQLNCGKGAITQAASSKSSAHKKTKSKRKIARKSRTSGKKNLIAKAKKPKSSKTAKLRTAKRTQSASKNKLAKSSPAKRVAKAKTTDRKRYRRFNDSHVAKK